MMLVPLAALWVPVAVAIVLAAGLVGIVLIRHARGAGPDADGHDSDSDEGGGPGRRRPRRPPPVGPVSWQDFERQFAAYVERRGAAAGRDGRGTGAEDEPDRPGGAAPRGVRAASR